MDLLALKAETWRNPESSQSARWAIPIGMVFEDIAALHTFNFLCLTPSPEVKKNCAWAAEVKLTVRLLRKNTELKNTKLFLSVWHGKELPLCDNLTLTLGWLWHWIHFWSQLITMEQGGVQVDSSWGQAPVNFENLWWNKLFEKWESWVLNFQ